MTDAKPDDVTALVERLRACSGTETAQLAAADALERLTVENAREMRGLRALSMHAYGLAVDLDAAHNALGDTTPFFKAGNLLVRSFIDEGWTWGGPWSRPDAMHFQYAVVG